MRVRVDAECEVEVWREGVETRMYASAATGAHQLAVFEQWCAPGYGAPSHVHAVEELLRIVAGEAEVWVGDDREQVAAGAELGLHRRQCRLALLRLARRHDAFAQQRRIARRLLARLVESRLPVALGGAGGQILGAVQLDQRLAGAHRLTFLRQKARHHAAERQHHRPRAAAGQGERGRQARRHQHRGRFGRLGFDAERGGLLGRDGNVGGERRTGEGKQGGEGENGAAHRGFRWRDSDAVSDAKL